MKSKHTITPHKGGRDTVLSPTRLTEEEKAMINRIKKKYNLSFADLVVNAIRVFDKMSPQDVDVNRSTNQSSEEN